MEKLTVQQLANGYVQSKDIDGNRRVSLYKEHNVYFVVVRRWNEVTNTGYDKLTEARKAYAKGLTYLKNN